MIHQIFSSEEIHLRASSVNHLVMMNLDHQLTASVRFFYDDLLAHIPRRSSLSRAYNSIFSPSTVCFRSLTALVQMSNNRSRSQIATLPYYLFSLRWTNYSSFYSLRWRRFSFLFPELTSVVIVRTSLPQRCAEYACMYPSGFWWEKVMERKRRERQMS